MSNTGEPFAFNSDLYPPLPTSTSIRLLHLISDSSETPQLRFALESFELIQPPEFIALSYTWGPSVFCEPFPEREESESRYTYDKQIKCNGVECAITENLFDAVTQLARSGYLGYIWVDALCINQGDNTERTCQVLLMGQIYATARQVIVWLGKDASYLESVLWLGEHVLPQSHQARFCL